MRMEGGVSRGRKDVQLGGTERKVVVDLDRLSESIQTLQNLSMTAERSTEAATR